MKKRILLAAIVLLLLAGGALGVLAVNKQNNEVIEGAGTSAHAQRPATTLTYNGETATLRRNIDTLLIAGTDIYDNSTYAGYYNFAQVDFLVVLVFDNNEKTVSALQLNRDTMCDVRRLNVSGDESGSRHEQLALAHTYGSGLEDSCENTQITVQRLLFDAPVDNYMVFTMDAVPIINDMVGGVTVTLDRDLTGLNPGWTAGSTQTLLGDDALRFVRVRMSLGETNNESRLGRHRAYLESFLTSATAAAEQDGDLGVKIYKACGDEICTDMELSQISDLSKRLQGYTWLGIRYPDGTDQKGELYNEFIVDADSLWAIVKDEWCK